jgi:hypothetical protein
VGQDAANVAEVIRNFLMGFVLPLWLATGVADWIIARQHRDDGRCQGIAHASSDADRGSNSGSGRIVPRDYVTGDRADDRFVSAA